MNRRPAVFVSNDNSLTDRPGGQQRCTKDYLDILRAAGFDPEIVAFAFRNPLADRIRRKVLGPRAYPLVLPDDLAARIVAAAARVGAATVFLNLTDTARLAPALRAALPPAVRLVFLSHGLESVDYVHTLRIGGAPSARDRRRLGEQLLVEAASRPAFDHVFTLAPFEAEIERWLGARQVTWLPQRVSAAPLPWAPVPGRAGFVGTLDHPPTVEALRLFLPELARRQDPPVRLRLVGGPAARGAEWAARFPCVDYLGPLDDAALEAEAATWTSYPQPLFCHARGASTKLATALGWRVPVVTTPAGARGYRWRAGGPVLAATAAEIADHVARLAHDDAARAAARAALAAAAYTCPTLQEAADRLNAALAGRGDVLDGACP